MCGALAAVGSSSELYSLHLKVSKMRHPLGPIPYHTYLNLRHDEPIPTPMLPHALMQMRQSPQVLDLLVVAFHPHAAVPAVEGFDEPDHSAQTAAVDQLGIVVGVVADEGGLGTHGGGGGLFG